MRCQDRTRDQQPYVSLLEGRRRSRYDRLLSAQLGTSENEDKGRGVIQPVVTTRTHWRWSEARDQTQRPAELGGKGRDIPRFLEQSWAQSENQLNHSG